MSVNSDSLKTGLNLEMECDCSVVKYGMYARKIIGCENRIELENGKCK